MSGERALPEQASLRYLKVEAKRRRAAGEFPTLHHAQLAIAREHGQPSWTALREAVDAASAAAGGEGHALGQLRWIAARFRDAGAPGWTGPDDAELRAHFTGQFLAEVTPGRLVAMITGVAAELGAGLTVLADLPFTARARLTGHLVTAVTEEHPPYRVSAARLQRLGERISDPRAASPATVSSAAAPGALPALAESTVTGLGLVGLSLAGRAGEGTWATAAGWADLERAEPLTPGHVFPVRDITMIVTAVAVLCLVAGGRLRLDDPAARYLGAVRLADEAVTVRDLLAHTSGVTDPPGLRGPAARALAEVTGAVLDCGGRRGAFGYSLAGYAALGEVIADRAGEAYQDAAARLVLGPLGMRDSWFPRSWPAGQRPGGPRPAPGPAVTGYDVTDDGTFSPLPGLVCVLPAAGGLWSTAADLARLGAGWSSLLPRSLAAQALRPHATRANGVRAGLGWAVNERAGLAGHGGDAPGGAASLLVTLGSGHACAALANRQAAVEPVNAQALAATAGGAAG